MIIAVTGPSGSGKTTISKMLASKHKWAHLCQDDFWRSGAIKFYMKYKDETHRLYEFAYGYNGEELAKQAAELPNVVIDGFSIMAFPEVRKIVDWHFSIDIPWSVTKERRLSRTPNSPSNIGWITLGERGNTLLTSFQKDLKNTTVLNGLDPVIANVETISEKIVELSKK